MTPNHHDFEVLCALAMSRELTSTEFSELHEHSEHCVFCRDRIARLTRVSFQMFLNHASKAPNMRLPKGMQERFAVRALSEGVPLNFRSSSMTALPTALGLMTALLLVLWVVAAPLKDGLFSRTIVQPELAGTSQVSKPVDEEDHSSRDILNRALPRKALSSRTSDRRRALRIGQEALPSLAPTSLPRRTFTLTRFPTLYSSSELASAMPSETIGSDTSHLSADYKYDTINIFGFRSNLALVYPAAQSSRRTLDLDAYKTPLKPVFKADLAAFRLIQNRIQ